MPLPHRPSALLGALLACSLAASAQADNARSDRNDYIRSENGQCAVWGSLPDQSDFVLRYQGGCQNGRAEGRGKAEWLSRPAGLTVRYRWEGEFRNGLFLGRHALKGRAEALPNGSFLIEIAAAAYLVTRTQADEAPALCQPERLLVSVPAQLATQDQDVQNRMRGAGQRLQALCPELRSNIRVAALAGAPELQGNGQLPAGFASAGFNPQTGQLGNFRNERSRQQAEEAAREQHAAAMQASRDEFEKLGRRHGVTAWVTIDQLATNPFRWEGQTVGTVALVEGMLTRERALIANALRSSPYAVQLAGIRPEEAGSQRPMLLIARVGNRQSFPGARPDDPELTLLHWQASIPCQQASCRDRLGWLRSGAGKLAWGEPWPAAAR
ncbi:hypothetical protein [Chitinilyticum litopenaei]|uniref:hypothetical protein n=1 Tax=Chitinilyticum litopenaei TaxID=1121276 RepID=UPI0004285466|nr:hypothetical protein [Chitinilyticum litopenaei]